MFRQFSTHETYLKAILTANQGYLNMRGTARKIFGDEIADQVKDVWGFDEEGELRTMWRRTGHSGTYISEQILPIWQ